MRPADSASATCRLSFPVPFALRQVEEAHARIGQERLERRPRVVLDAVADDEQLDRRSLLGERALHRVRQCRRVAICRNENRWRRSRRQDEALSRSIAATTSAPSSALDFGGGPPSRCSTNVRSSASKGSSPGVSTCSPSASVAPARRIVTCVSQPPASEAVPSAQCSSTERRYSGIRDDTVSVCHAGPASSVASTWRTSSPEARPTADTGCGTRPRISSAIERSWGASTQTLSTSSCVVPSRPASSRARAPGRAAPSARSPPVRERPGGSATCPSRRAGRARARSGGRPRRVRAERLLHEDGHAVVERGLHDLCVRARGGRDDDPVDVPQLRDVSDDGACAAVPRSCNARLGARHDRHGAAERRRSRRMFAPQRPHPTRPTTIARP